MDVSEHTNPVGETACGRSYGECDRRGSKSAWWRYWHGPIVLARDVNRRRRVAKLCRKVSVCIRSVFDRCRPSGQDTVRRGKVLNFSGCNSRPATGRSSQ